MPAASPKFILSYRRADTQGITGRIFDRLANHFGASNVFMDIDSLPVGVDFSEHLRSVLNTCGVFIAVIGPHYAGPRRGKPPRIMDATDWVRLELETALDLGVPIVPVLVQGASLPAARHLPTSLHGLLRRNALELSDGRDFQVHINRLIEGLELLTNRIGVVEGRAKSLILDDSREVSVRSLAAFGRKLTVRTCVGATLATLGLFGAAFALNRHLDAFGVERQTADPNPFPTTIQVGASPTANCERWRQKMARFWSEFQNHEGSGYSVVARTTFLTASAAQEEAARLRRDIAGNPRFSVARHAKQGRYVVGFGFNISEAMARELSEGVTVCYDIETAVMDPSVALVSPMRIEEESGGSFDKSALLPR